MDLLCSAYCSSGSDEEDKWKKDHHHHNNSSTAVAPLPGRYISKRERSAYCSSGSDEEDKSKEDHHHHNNSSTSEAPLPGRYISKRERAGPTQSKSPIPAPLLPSPGTLSDAHLSRHIFSKLRNPTNWSATAQRPSITLNAHTRSVNALHWSTTHPHLLASAGMDNTICIWNVWSPKNKQARLFKCHTAAVKDVKWSHQGLFTLSCGYDCTSRLVDVEKSVETQAFIEDQMIGVVKFHPQNCNLFISGGSKGHLKLWDVRSGKVVHEYVRNLGPILDVEFTPDGNHFISSSDVSRSNISENAIVVWDISRQVPVSNQVYVEAYTCTCIRSHPYDPYFVAQSNANYIAIFSSKPPFKLDKYKRFESHGVSGFPIKCNFSISGDIIASGSSDGCVYIYDSRSARLIEKIKAFAEPCTDVAFHPVMPHVVASCSWNGSIMVFG